MRLANLHRPDSLVWRPPLFTRMLVPTSTGLTIFSHCTSIVNEKKQGVVFLLWGQFAIKKAKGISKTKHHILEAAHPSPLVCLMLCDAHSFSLPFLDGGNLGRWQVLGLWTFFQVQPAAQANGEGTHLLASLSLSVCCFFDIPMFSQFLSWASGQWKEV